VKNCNSYSICICFILIGASFLFGCNATKSCTCCTDSLQYLYDEVSNPDSLWIKDSDYDGVLDKNDKEPNTVEFAAVNFNGITLDSDKDGCLDYEDPEPFSSPVLPLRDCKFESFICDTKDPPSCREIKKSDIDSNFFLPFIEFKLNSAVIEPDQVFELNYIADILNEKPTVQIQLSGMTITNWGMFENLGINMERIRGMVLYLNDLGIKQEIFTIEINSPEKRMILDTESETIGIILFELIK
jgi:hypothetical protein